MKKVLLGFLSLSVIVNPMYAAADEITVSGNAQGSTNNVNVSMSQNTQTTQNNNAEINNNIDLNANTGNNTANENSGGGTNVSTGDATSNTEIVNAGINQSYVETGCCNGGTSVNISGNGSNTNNLVNYSSNGSNNVTVNNNANISNNVNGKLNTGYNKANYNNGGDVSIITGSIEVNDTIRNKSINIAEVNAQNGQGGSIYLAVNDNGADSNNSILLNNENEIEIDVDNSANIVNNSTWDLNTGKNSANGNNGGEVKIATGDIVLNTTIENTDINTSIVDVDCCDEEKEIPVDGNPPPSNPSNGGNGPASNGNGGSSSGGPTSDGPTLPVTGGASLLVLALVNTVMFFMGWYLRLRSGRSPNLARI